MAGSFKPARAAWWALCCYAIVVTYFAAYGEHWWLAVNGSTITHGNRAIDDAKLFRSPEGTYLLRLQGDFLHLDGPDVSSCSSNGFVPLAIAVYVKWMPPPCVGLTTAKFGPEKDWYFVHDEFAIKFPYKAKSVVVSFGSDH